jgi:ATP-binding protein involved in chromosome partitioning
MLRIDERPKAKDENTLLPLENHGVKCMSIGFLTPQGAPTIWRGPMVSAALDQMLKSVDWEPLDCLLIDLPPGTGDAQLTISQNANLDGAVIVSTPQDVALSDVTRGMNMFAKVNVPLIGMIENMSHYICPHCGHEDFIFGRGGAERKATELGLDFLGKIPLHASICEGADAGVPILVAHKDSAISEAYRDVAKRMLEHIQEMPKKQKPVIQME